MYEKPLNRVPRCAVLPRVHQTSACAGLDLWEPGPSRHDPPCSILFLSHRPCSASGLAGELPAQGAHVYRCSHVLAGVILAGGITGNCDDQKFSLIPPEHWPDFKIEHYRYPTMAGMAGVQGQVLLAIAINKEGSIDRIKAISGPPPLGPYAESLFNNHKFSNLPTNTSAPWIFFAVADFRVVNKRVFITPAKREQIPPPKFKE